MFLAPAQLVSSCGMLAVTGSVGDCAIRGFTPPFCHIAVHLSVRPPRRVAPFDSRRRPPAAGANALGPCACISSSVKRIRAHARLLGLSSLALLRAPLAAPSPPAPPLPLCPSPPPAASQSAARAAFPPLLIGPCALRMQILLGGLDSADFAPPLHPPLCCAVSLTRSLPQHHHDPLVSL